MQAAFAGVDILKNMAVPTSTGGASRELAAWQELEEVFSELGQLARSPIAPHEFYRSLIEDCLRVLSAAGGVAWLRAGHSFDPVAMRGEMGADDLRTESARRAHESMLREAMAAGGVLNIGPHTRNDEHSAAANPTDHVLLLGPVHLPALEESADAALSPRETNHGPAVAVIALWLPAGASPATVRGREDFLAAVCELASDFHAFHELRRLRHIEQDRGALVEFSRQSHARLDLPSTGYTVANEGRRVMTCDRLSVLVMRGKRCELLAASGVSQVERRSSAARRLSEVGTLICRTDEPATYVDGECDALPPVAEAIARHVEESHARCVAAIPLRVPVATTHADDSALQRQRTRSDHSRPRFVLIAEQFNLSSGELDRERLVEVAQVSASALYHALEYDRLPFGWMLRPLGRLKDRIAAHTTRAAVIAIALAALVALLVLVPAEFTVEAPGTLQPTVERHAFAPRSAIVEEVLVAHGTEVKAGQPLLRLRDSTLELELKRVDGELETAQRQLDAVRATRTNRGVRDADPVDSYRLSAEERELEQRATNLRREHDLLERERNQLTVVSPIAGRVMTWDIGREMQARPVERGDVLATVADLSSPWQVELAVPGDRIGYVLAAQHALHTDLSVTLQLSSEERTQHTGRIVEVSRMTDVPRDRSSAHPRPTIPATVALDSPDFATHVGHDFRPGTSVRAQIACGRRSLGYVWLHDVCNAVVEWWRFL